jgi:CRP-like cAMP-binding protein
MGLSSRIGRDELLSRVFPSLGDDAIVELDGLGYGSSFAEGELIAQEDTYASGVYVVQTGLVSIGKYGGQDGGKRVLRFLASGELFGVEAILTGHPVNVQFAKALVASQLVFFERRELIAFIEQHPELCRDLARWLSREVIMLEFKLTRAAVESTDRNLALLLLALAKNYGKDVDEGVVVDLPISRQVIAEMLGVSIDTLTRLLKRFRERNLLDTSGRHIVITDMDRLKERARTTPFYISIIEETL